MDATAEAILDGLDDAQRMAATAVRGPVRIIAGAGAGKTRTVTRRIAYACATKAWDPRATLAVTFSVKAAAEMRNRLSQLDVASDVKAATFHSAALHQLRRIWPDVCEGPMPFISRNPREIVEHSLRRVTTQQVDDDTVRNLQAEINWCKISLIAPEDYERVCAAIHHQPPAGLEPSQFVDIYRAYETEKPIATKSTSTTSCSSPATSSKATKTWRPTSAPASHGSPSTNTKTSRPCSIGCSPDGSVTTATSAWSATRHRPSTRSPEPAATTCSTSPPNSTPHRRRQTQQRLPFHPADRQLRQPRARSLTATRRLSQTQLQARPRPPSRANRLQQRSRRSPGRGCTHPQTRGRGSISGRLRHPHPSQRAAENPLPGTGRTTPALPRQTRQRMAELRARG